MKRLMYVTYKPRATYKNHPISVTTYECIKSIVSFVTTLRNTDNAFMTSSHKSVERTRYLCNSSESIIPCVNYELRSWKV